MSDDLKKIRKLIDMLDTKILKSLNQRGMLAQKIKKAKDSSDNKSLYRPERETQILKKLERLNEGPLSKQHIQSIYKEIISACLSLEIKLSISCLGPEESYSSIALNKFFGSSVKKNYTKTLADIFYNVKNQTVDYGVVPIENSNQGSVREALQHLIASEVRICGEVNLNIKHCLLSTSNNISSIKKVYAHEQTFLQCDAWLNKNLPNIKRNILSSNSAAAKKVSNLKDSAAIASRSCSKLYNLTILRNNINDNVDNTTRFIVIGSQFVNSSGFDKTSILITVPNKSGSLNNVLKYLSDSNISMTKIESIPTKINNWEYMFMLDIDGHIDDKIVKRSLEKIKNNCVFFMHLGSYPKSI